MAGMPKQIAFLTLGCAKNEVDSAQMQEDLVCAGFEIVDIESSYDALVINTCAFIQPANCCRLSSFALW